MNVSVEPPFHIIAQDNGLMRDESKSALLLLSVKQRTIDIILKGQIYHKEGKVVMAIWVVRAGRNGEWEKLDFENNISSIIGSNLPDLTNITTREAIEDLYRKTHPEPEVKQMTIANAVGQIFAFRTKILHNDWIALPISSKGVIRFGKVTGKYTYRTDLPDNIHHTIPVAWMKESLPKSDFEQDILYSMGSVMTVFQVQRNNAESRITAILERYQQAQPIIPDKTPIPTDEIEIPRIFISHSHHDNEMALKLAADLRVADAEVWVDLEDIQYGDFVEKIDQALLNCQWFVPILSPHAIISAPVKLETSAAVNLLWKEKIKGIIPFVATAFDHEKWSPLLDALQRYDAVQSGYDIALSGLMKALHLS